MARRHALIGHWRLAMRMGSRWLKEILGHALPSMTMRYAHLAKDHLEML